MKGSENKYIKAVSIAILTAMSLGLLGFIGKSVVESAHAKVRVIAKKEVRKSSKLIMTKVNKNETASMQRMNKIDEKLDKIIFHLIK